MTPRKAGALELEEPDWCAMFEQECLRKPHWARSLREIDAFETTFKAWRTWHGMPVEVDGEMKKEPATPQDAMIALAGMGIMPPRNETRDVPRGSAVEGYQHDDHMWMSIRNKQTQLSEQWRIVAIEDRMMFLEKGFEDGSADTTQINLATAKWEKYTEAAVAAIEQMKAPRGENAR